MRGAAAWMGMLGLCALGAASALASPLLPVPALRAARQLQANAANAGSSSASGSGSPSSAPPWWSGLFSGSAASGFSPTLGSLPPCPSVCVPIAPGVAPTLAQFEYEQEHQCNLVVSPPASVSCQPVASMSVSANYLNGLLPGPGFEGDVHQYYNDSQCNCTAGVGHLISRSQCPPSLAAPGKQKTPQATNKCVKNTWWQSPNAFPGASVSNAQIAAWEKEDIAWAVNIAKITFTKAGIKSVTQTEFDAVVDLIYNGGFGQPNIYHIKADIINGNFQGAISGNTLRAKNNGIASNRLDFENGGLAEGDLCK